MVVGDTYTIFLWDIGPYGKTILKEKKYIPRYMLMFCPLLRVVLFLVVVFPNFHDLFTGTPVAPFTNMD